MSEMVERVARAIFAEQRPDDSYERFLQYSSNPHVYTRLAHAAVSAMREPTPEMMDEGVDALLGQVGGADLGGHFSASRATMDVYRAMIDAALPKL